MYLSLRQHCLASLLLQLCDIRLACLIHRIRQMFLDTPLMQERIRHYMNAIVDLFQQQFSTSSNLRLDIERLRETVESCLCDIYRLNVFRGIHQEDNHKRAAFFMVWLERIKPIRWMGVVRDEAEVKANE